MTEGAVLAKHRRRSLGRDFRAVWMAVVVSSTGDGMFITADRGRLICRVCWGQGAV